MTEPRRKRGAERTSNRGPAPIAQLPPRRVTNPYPPMALLSSDQIEAIHQASMHILENFGIEVMSRRALSLFEKAGATVDHAMANVRVDRGMVEEALKTT
ncbi:MAG: methyltransferase, partial [Mesorhizobium sp.]